MDADHLWSLFPAPASGLTMIGPQQVMRDTPAYYSVVYRGDQILAINDNVLAKVRTGRLAACRCLVRSCDSARLTTSRSVAAVLRNRRLQDHQHGKYDLGLTDHSLAV